MRKFILIAFIACLVSVTEARSASVQVTPTSDFNLGTWGMNDSAISSTMDLCIYANSTSPSGSYAITVTSDNGGFFVANGINHIPYTLYWEDSGASNLGNNSPGTLLNYGSKLTGRANASTLSQTCGLGLALTARLTLKITQSDMQSALAGTYTDKIYILLSPT